MKVVLLEQFALPGDALQQKGDQSGLEFPREVDEAALEFGGVFRPVVGRHAHAEEQHAGAGFLPRADDGGKIVAHLRQRQPAQAVVPAQLHDQDRGPMAGKGFFDAARAAAGGLAADARVDDGIIEALSLQAFLQQAHPAAALADSVGGGQAVAIDQHFRRGMRGRCGQHQHREHRSA